MLSIPVNIYGHLNAIRKASHIKYRYFIVVEVYYIRSNVTDCIYCIGPTVTCKPFNSFTAEVAFQRWYLSLNFTIYYGT